MAKGLSPLDESTLNVIEGERGSRLSVDRLFYILTEKCNLKKLKKKKLMISLKKLNRRGDIKMAGKTVRFNKS